MLKKKTVIFFILLLSTALALFFAPKYFWPQGKLRITEIKMASAINEKLLPEGVTEIFPEGTAKVYCWFKWQDAKINMPITAKWYYTTDDIHILDYTFNLPRKKSAGSVSLSMPENKKLPSGEYRIDLAFGRKVLRSLVFSVE